MALGDIKNAGILAGFVRWGWPWHGLIQAGAIAGTGRTHPQPAINESWLIDMGLPAVDITTEQAAAEALEGRTWLNYALCPRGYVYSKAIGDSSFVHVDGNGARWKIELSFSFPASQTLRITANITEFGVLRIQDAASAVTVQKIVDVVCTQIELAGANALPVDVTYTTRSARIEDVYTNGERALIGVHLSNGVVADLYSVVTLTLSGAGGSDGSGLVMTAVESIAQTALTLGADSSQVLTYATDYHKSVRYTDNFTSACPGSGTYTVNFYIYDNLTPHEVGAVTNSWATYARYAFFAADGTPTAVRMRHGFQETVTRSFDTGWALDYVSANYSCTVNPPSPTPAARRYGRHFLTRETGWQILENSTVVDRLSWTRNLIQDAEWRAVVGSNTTTEILTTVSDTTSPSGSLAAYMPSVQLTITGSAGVAAAFRGAAVSAYTTAATIDDAPPINVGIHRMNSKATAFILVRNGAGIYGTASTPVGSVTPAVAAASTVNFAWNKKTGEYTFAAGALCYV